MKIIVAGYPQTGTKTLITALKTLGYTVFDFSEHFFYHGNDWNKIFDGKGSSEDFKRMYEDVEVVADIPVFYFWEEISQVFPDAKVKFHKNKKTQELFQIAEVVTKFTR